MLSGLFTTVTNVNFNPDTIRQQIDLVHREKEKLVPLCSDCASSSGKNDDYPMERLWEEQEDIRSLESPSLFGLRGMGANVYHAMVLGYSDQTVNRIFYEGMASISYDLQGERLLSLVLKLGKVNLKYMELLDKADTETFGNPSLVKVPFKVENTPPSKRRLCSIRRVDG